VRRAHRVGKRKMLAGVRPRRGNVVGFERVEIPTEAVVVALQIELRFQHGTIHVGVERCIRIFALESAL
jgi:hypothetical protein